MMTLSKLCLTKQAQEMHNHHVVVKWKRILLIFNAGATHYFLCKQLRNWTMHIEKLWRNWDSVVSSTSKKMRFRLHTGFPRGSVKIERKARLKDMKLSNEWVERIVHVKYKVLPSHVVEAIKTEKDRGWWRRFVQNRVLLLLCLFCSWWYMNTIWIFVVESVCITTIYFCENAYNITNILINTSFIIFIITVVRTKQMHWIFT